MGAENCADGWKWVGAGDERAWLRGRQINEENGVADGVGAKKWVGRRSRW